MGEDDENLRNEEPGRPPGTSAGLLRKVRRFLARPKWGFPLAMVAALATALCILRLVHFQAQLLGAGDLIRAIVVVGLAAISSGAFAFFTIRLVDQLAGDRLAKMLKGDEPLSFQWFYLAVLGVVLGGGVALFTDLGRILLLLPRPA